jgi:hypothetical protein
MPMSQTSEVKAAKSDEVKFHTFIHKTIDKPYRVDKPHKREHSSRWADTVVTSATKNIAITVHINFKSPKLTEAERLNLINLAAQGISKYWSREITVDGVLYKVSVTAMHKSDSPLPAILKIDQDTKDYGRSVNAGVLGVDARFIYNSGFFQNTNFADDDFKLVCAHEFGHSVLKAAGGISLSWGHKGTTGVISQAVKKSTPGYPNSGPIDLMKYYDDKKQKASFSQLVNDSIVSEKDLMRLIWLSKIQWK